MFYFYATLYCYATNATALGGRCVRRIIHAPLIYPTLRWVASPSRNRPYLLASFLLALGLAFLPLLPVAGATQQGQYTATRPAASDAASERTDRRYAAAGANSVTLASRASGGVAAVRANVLPKDSPLPTAAPAATPEPTAQPKPEAPMVQAAPVAVAPPANVPPGPTIPFAGYGNWSSPSQKELATILTRWANRHGQDANFMVRVAMCESTLNNRAVGAAGELSFLQFMPATFAANARAVGLRNADILNPEHTSQVAAWMFSRGQAYQWTCARKLMGRS